jgi:GNAT superfamily N-acetyltransferase
MHTSYDWNVSSLHLAIETVPFASPAAQAMISAAADELDRLYGPETDPVALEPSTFEAPHGAFLVGRRDAHLVGGVGIRAVSREAVEVKRLWVRPDVRRSGIGLALMRAAESAAIDVGRSLLVLETGPLQPGAAALYRTEGWEQVDELPVPISDHDGSLRFFKQLR